MHSHCGMRVRRKISGIFRRRHRRSNMHVFLTLLRRQVTKDVTIHYIGAEQVMVL